MEGYEGSKEERSTNQVRKNILQEKEEGQRRTEGELINMNREFRSLL